MTITDKVSAPLFTVVGATGGQGASVIRALKASAKPYRVRAATRDVNQPAAKALAALGCEVSQVDIDTKAGAEIAFEGSDVVFGMSRTDPSSPLAVSGILPHNTCRLFWI